MALAKAVLPNFRVAREDGDVAAREESIDEEFELGIGGGVVDVAEHELEAKLVLGHFPPPLFAPAFGLVDTRKVPQTANDVDNAIAGNTIVVVDLLQNPHQLQRAKRQ